MMEKRKNPRLKGFDYSQPGSYFITVCSKDKAHIFGRISVGRVAPGAPCIELTPISMAVEKNIMSVNRVYENISVDKYVVMPNHNHLLLTISAHGAPGATRPTDLDEKINHQQTSISQVVTSIKRLSNKETGQKLWQSSFYDHIIRRCVKKMCRWHIFSNRPQELCSEEGN